MTTGSQMDKEGGNGVLSVNLLGILLWAWRAIRRR